MIGTDADLLFSRLSPGGYYIALRVGFAFPMAERNLFPRPWIEHYTRNGYMLHDPVIRWLYQNAGACRWSEIPVPDSRGILTDAKTFGLDFGLSISCVEADDHGQRSFGSFVRADREFSDSEIDALTECLSALHKAGSGPKNLTQAEIVALKMVRDGLLMKEIANRLGISEGAVKQRLRNAKAKLKSKTNSQAVAKAQGFGLL